MSFYILRDFSIKNGFAKLFNTIITQKVIMNNYIICLYLSICHFEQDILFMLGNIMHHSDISGMIDKSNATFVDVSPQGKLIILLFYHFIQVTLSLMIMKGFCLNTMTNYFWCIWLFYTSRLIPSGRGATALLGSGAQRRRLARGGAWRARRRRDRMCVLSRDRMYMRRAQ